MERDIYTEEHELFREAYRTFIEREMVPHREKWELDGIVDPAVFRAAGEAGFLGMGIPEEYGGSGL